VGWEAADAERRGGARGARGGGSTREEKWIGFARSESGPFLTLMFFPPFAEPTRSRHVPQSVEVKGDQRQTSARLMPIVECSGLGQAPTHLLVLNCILKMLKV
jgi:hypothetical protein